MLPAGSGEEQRSGVHTSGTSAAYLARRIISPASTPPTLTLGCICGHTASSVSSVCRWNSSGKTCAQAGCGQRARTSTPAAKPCLDHRVHQVRLGDVVFAVDDLLQDARQHGCLVQLQVYALQLAQHLQRAASAGYRWAMQGCTSHQQVLAHKVTQLLPLLLPPLLQAQGSGVLARSGAPRRTACGAEAHLVARGSLVLHANPELVHLLASV